MESEMAYRDELERICSEIDDAKAAVVNAHRSRNVNAINKADRRLADLHAEARECMGGNIPDDR
jgi:hypothetical protein